jgi:hypothetical protein
VEDAPGEVEVLEELAREDGRKGSWKKVCWEHTAVTTVLFASRPLKISTLEPLRSPSTT